jgi:TP901 family phage tail tape measure protein
MDSTMTIQVRVVGRQAIAQLQQVQNAVNGVARAGAGSNAKNTAGFFGFLNGQLIKAGKNLQWVGRQLTFNFTLPLVAAGAALFKTNMAIEKSMTGVIKVYGDATFSSARIKEETDLLSDSFQLLSTRFGVHQEKVVDIAAAWAQAGSAGAGLAGNVRGTLEAMVLGQMEATEATNGLIAIQAVWGLSTLRVGNKLSDLGEALALLNVVENQTGIEFSGLIDVFTRAGGAARTSGMSIRELASFAAALVPATGSAAQAGNALKTMISRLQSPTGETAEMLGLMGINVRSVEWGSKSATDKILDLATSFNALDQAAKNQVSSIIASRWQINRFNVLMQDVANTSGYFNKAMAATADQAAANATYIKELNTVLSSNPKKWDIMLNAVRNVMADAFIPMIPVIMTILRVIQDIAQAFADLPEGTRKIIIFALALIALVGPVLQLMGVFMELIGVLGHFVRFLVTGVFFPLKLLAVGIIKVFALISTALMALPWWGAVAIVAAVVLAILAIVNDDFRQGLIDFVKSVGKAFAWLPKIIASVFNSIIKIIGRAIEIIRDALSYLNPFARHSPSLVDNVRAGVATILDEYQKFRQIPAIIRSAINALQMFGAASAPGARSFEEATLSGYVKTISANNPAAGGAAAAMVPQIMALYDQLGPLTEEIAAQAVVVAQWSAQVAAANAVLAVEEAALDALKVQFSDIGDQLQSAKDRLDELANMKITGMTAMEDAIFGITMQQTELNLALVDFERQGYTLDSIRNKYAALNGEIEMLRGEQASLRSAGAGSDILSVYDDQISAIEAQRESLGGVEQQIIDIQAQLESLDLEKRWQELTKSITFDPLLRQIDQMVNGVNEMSFDDLVAGIQEQQALIADLQPQYDALAQSVADQEAYVQQLTASRDALLSVLDAEQAKLDGLTDAYQGIKNLIDEMTAALRDYADTANSVGGGGSGGAELLPGDYEVLGGSTTLGAEGTAADIQAFNDALNAELQAALEGMGIPDVFKKIREGWQNFIQWAKNLWSDFTGWFSNAWEEISNNPAVAKIIAISTAIGGALVAAWDAVYGFVSEVVGWFEKNVLPTIQAFGEAVMAVWGAVRPVIEGIGRLLGPYLIPIVYALIAAFRLAWNVISGVIGFIVNLLEGFLRIIRGIFQVIAGLFTGDWKKLWEGVKNIVGGVIDIIVAIFEHLKDVIATTIEFIATIVVGLFVGLVETIKAIPGAIVAVFDGIWDAIWNIGKSIIDGLLEGLKSAVGAVWNWLMWMPRHAIELIKDLFGISSPSTVFAEIGVNLMLGLLNGLVSAVKAVWNFFKELPGKILGLIGNAAEWLWDTGWDIAIGILNGIIAAAEKIWGWVKNLPSKLLGLFGSASTWLFDIGKKIIQGLWDGLKSAWEGVKDWFGSITDLIPDLKGPPDKDAGLLYENGRLIIGGLQNGMQAGWSTATEWLTGIAAEARGFVNADLFMTGYNLSIAMVGDEETQKQLLIYLDNMGLGIENVAADVERANQEPINYEAMTQFKEEIEDATSAWWAMKAVIVNNDVERQALLLAQGFDDVKQSVYENQTAVNEWRMTSEEQTRRNRLDLIDLQNQVAVYATEVLKLPAEQITQVLALIDQGKLDEAETLLQNFANLKRTIIFDSEVKTPVTRGGPVKYMAAGGIVDKATLMVAGEAGREVIIPLTDANRARQLAEQSGLMSLLNSANNKMTMTGKSMSSPLVAAPSTKATIININGDLAFPNISDPNDAKKFISNLKVIAS